MRIHLKKSCDNDHPVVLLEIVVIRVIVMLLVILVIMGFWRMNGLTLTIKNKASGNPNKRIHLKDLMSHPDQQRRNTPSSTPTRLQHSYAHHETYHSQWRSKKLKILTNHQNIIKACIKLKITRWRDRHGQAIRQAILKLLLQPTSNKMTRTYPINSKYVLQHQNEEFKSKR